MIINHTPDSGRRRDVTAQRSISSVIRSADANKHNETSTVRPVADGTLVTGCTGF